MSSTCGICNSKCQFCEYSDTTCTSCNSNQFRLLNVNTCDCLPGYFENASQDVCQTCDPRCLTCTNNSTNCTTCDSNINR